MKRSMPPGQARIMRDLARLRQSLQAAAPPESSHARRAARKYRKPTALQRARAADFTRLQKRIAALVAWLDVKVPKRDGTVSVDLADLRMKCADVRSLIDALAATPRHDRNRALIEERLLRLFTELDHFSSYHRDAIGPVDRLWLALSRSNKRRNRVARVS